MELPILSNSSLADPQVLLRAVKKSNRELCAISGESTVLEGGEALSQPDRPDIWDANCVYDLHIPANHTADSVWSEIEAHFASIDQTCFLCIPSNHGLPSEMATLLHSKGYKKSLMQLMQIDTFVNQENCRTDLQIVPAQAIRQEYREFRHFFHLHEWGELAADSMADYQLDALDDGHLEMFVARINGIIVACGGVYAAGEIGILSEIATHPDWRRQGIMKSMLAWLFEHCARSQFKMIVLETDLENKPAITLYESFGMIKSMEFPVYRNSPTKNQP